MMALVTYRVIKLNYKLGEHPETGYWDKYFFVRMSIFKNKSRLV